MIKKSGYLILSVISYGILESILLGYKYYIIFMILLFFIISFDVIIFNIAGSKMLKNIDIYRKIDNTEFKKNKNFKIRIYFKNNNKYEVSLSFFDEAIDILKIHGESNGIIKIPGNTVITREYDVIPEYIGKYTLGNINISIFDLFKISYIDKTYYDKKEIKISPPLNEINANRSEMLSNFIYTFGVHYSKNVGQGYDLYGIRQYVETDDPRYIAWDRYSEYNNTLLTKQMEEEREITAIFLIDYSSSMNYGSPDRIYDKLIVNIINSAYNINKNHDNIGFYLYSSDIDYFIKPDKMGESIKSLEKLVSNILPSGYFNMLSAIDSLNKKIRKKFLVFIFTASDIKIYKPVKNFSLTLFLINIESFYNYKPKNDFDELMMKSFRIKEICSINNKVKYLRNSGIKCNYINSDNMVSKIMLEYNYNRSINIGAS